MADTSGVNLLTGKVNLSVPLGSISGPAGFGESISLSYSTTGLLQQIKTWNQDAPTSTVGLGWSLELPYITRMGSGSLKDSFYLVSGGSVLPLMIAENTEFKAGQSYSFVTQASSLMRIMYQPDKELWVIQDGNGNKYKYGRRDTNACAMNIRWKHLEDGQPATWIGTSTEERGQETYVSTWHLESKTTQSGQKVEYIYDQVTQNVGTSGGGDSYTVAIYPHKIIVDQGGHLEFTYKKKKSYEYPPSKVLKSNTNAFQDRVETRFLDNVKFYDAYKILQNKVKLNYDSLYSSDFALKLPADSMVDTMNKRLLTSIDTLTIDDSITQVITEEGSEVENGRSVKIAPSQKFDYWGLSSQDQVLQDQIIKYSQTIINGTQTNTFTTLPTSAFSYAGLKIDGRTYNALFGHLKKMETPAGGLRWYSYSDNSLDYSMLDTNERPNPIPKSNWNLKLDFDVIVPTFQVKTKKKNSSTDYIKENVKWEHPKPYWGADNYVVIMWEATTHSDNRKWVCLQIYEWVGKWILSTCQRIDAGNIVDSKIPDASPKEEDLIFHVSDFGEQYIRLAIGAGTFALIRTNISVDDTDEHDRKVKNPINPFGNVTLIHRDLYMPGLWKSTYFKTQFRGFINLKTEDGDDIDIHAPEFQAQLSVGDNIAALLDVLRGKLYLYSLSNNQWFMYEQGKDSYKKREGINITADVRTYRRDSGTGKNHAFPTAMSALSIKGKSVFVLSTEADTSHFITKPFFSDPIPKNIDKFTATPNYNIQAIIYNYLPYKEEPGKWSFQSQQDIVDILEEIEERDRSLSTGISLRYMRLDIQEYSITAQFFIFIDNRIISRPVVISWDQDASKLKIRVQKIYSPNSTSELSRIILDELPEDKNPAANGSPPVIWGNLVMKANKDDLLGELYSSNLVNITTLEGEVRKYVARYVGGNQIKYYGRNVGWLSNHSLKTVEKDFDAFASMATFDTTIAVPEEHKYKYNYAYYQFNPYYQYELDANGNFKKLSDISQVSINAWLEQVEVDIGANFDAAEAEYIFDLILNIISFALAPITLISGAIAVEGIFATIVSKGINLVDFIVNGPQSFAYGFIESAIISNLVRNQRSSDGYSGQSYNLVGTTEDNGQPRSYYRIWDDTKKNWKWQTADQYKLLATLPSLPLPTIPDDVTGIPYSLIGRLSNDVYRYGASFMPLCYRVNYKVGPNAFDHYSISIYKDQIACLRNGILSKLLSTPTFNKVYKVDGYDSLKFDNMYYTLHQNQGDDYSLYAPWGGILLYQPSMKQTGGRGRYLDVIEDFNIQKSNALKLCMYQDESIAGGLSDYVVDKVSVDDGYQVYDTHIQYESDRAIYHGGLGSVVYNQVNVAAGALDYKTAAQNNGWMEQYSYNGFSQYTRVPGDGLDELLPYDPATDQSNPYYADGLHCTNANIRLNPLFNQSYCQRLLKYNTAASSDSTSKSIEMVRQYSYYTAYNQTARDSDGKAITSIQYSRGIQVLNRSPLQTNGNIMTLQQTLTAPDNTSATYIKDLPNNGYLITEQRLYYDLEGLAYLGIENNALLTDLTKLTDFQTGLLLWQDTLSNHYNKVKTSPIAQFTRSINKYAFQIAHYTQDFLDQKMWLWNPVVLNVTCQTADDMEMLLLPVAASATFWQSADTIDKDKSPQNYWYPRANYRWVGNVQKYICTRSLPWETSDSTGAASDLIYVGDDWQLDSYVRNMQNGIVYDTVKVIDTKTYEVDETSETYFQGPRSVVIYDKYNTFPIARITLPNLSAGLSDDSPLIETGNEFIRFCSFEEYEDLSSWKYLDPNNSELNTIMSYDLVKSSITPQTYYAGSQSLQLFYNTDSSGTSSTPTIYWQALDSSIFTPSTLNATPTQAILSFYTMTKRSNEDVLDVGQLTISLAVAIIQPGMTDKFVQVSDSISVIQFGLNYKNNNWAYQQNVIDLYSPIEQAIERGDIAKNDSYRILIGFNFMDFFRGSGTFTSDLYIDTLSLVPVSSIAQFNIYDQKTKLLSASLDLNGTTSRMIYDSRRRMIGSSIGQNNDQAVVSCPVTYYSRENEQAIKSGQTLDAFNNTDPNSQTLIQPASGGQYFDFRINGDLMDWTGTDINVSGGGLFVKPSDSAQQAFQSPYTRGVAIRAQVMPSNGYIKVEKDQPRDFSNLVNTRISLIDDAGDQLSVTFNTNSNDEYQFELKRRNGTANPTVDIPVTIPNIPTTWTPDDWLLALIDQSVYFFINGQLIIQTPVDPSDDSSNPFEMSGLTAVLGNNDVATPIDIAFSNIMLMQDPRLSSVYTDGTGKTRQTQVVADLPSPTQPSAA